MNDDSDIFDYLARGGKLSAPGNTPPRYRAELLRLMASFVDSELAGAAGFADCINLGPGVKERIAAARIVLEKLDHAERVLKIMGDFGANVTRYQNLHPWAARIARHDDIGLKRQAGDMRLNVFHYPIAGWTDAVVLNVLMGTATVIQLGDFAVMSYQPLAETFRAILPREQRHAELGQEGLNAAGARGSAAQKEISDSVDYWFPKVAATFGAAASPRTELLRRFGIRRRPNADMLDEWRGRVSAALGSCLRGWNGRA
ncbi:MAG TPA: phenylacetic acid catabolic [Parvularcula sp.]|nr:phenylacetic acid catabolic [Parvularcula sp.]HBS36280.1 phenylacetic acid catabolic [Parvularcula sp.]